MNISPFLGKGNVFTSASLFVKEGKKTNSEHNWKGNMIENVRAESPWLKASES